METKNYWVGDRPGGAWFFTVLDQETGSTYDVGGFTRVRAILKDSDNKEYIFPEANVSVTNALAGEVTVLWPTESIFTKPGLYVLQLEFYAPSSTRRTSVQEIRVRELGGVTR